MLSDRRQKVLTALIEEYIARALPVGSRTLAEQYHLGVSSATVRNELSILEEAGYVLQPHTSSGRIPTDTGYRAFVDDLLHAPCDDDTEQDENAIRELRDRARELDDLLEETSQALTRLTDCLAIVLPPSVATLYIKQISLISMTPRRILMVVVTEDAQVLNRNIDFHEEVAAADVMRSQAMVNDLFSGHSFAELRQSLTEKQVPTPIDDLTRIVIGELFACLKDNTVGRPHRLGMTSLLAQPEFSRSSVVLPVLEQLEDDEVLIHLFEDAAGSTDPVVRIGHENQTEALSGVSLVASRFGSSDNEGLIAIVGPTRMNYSQVLKAIRAARNALQDI